MASIDKRVVEIKFDNKDFEKGVKETLITLQNLEKGLKLENATRGLADIGKAADSINMNSMASSLDNISSKFSALGAVGFTVIQNLTNGVISFGQKTLGAALDPIFEGGKRRAENIEAAKFAFKGLGLSIEESDRAMKDALYAVKGTAYGLDAAARAASQLSASSVTLGPDMQASLRGISGVAAMTSSSYEDIADVFTKVAGQGRLMGDDLNRLASRGLNVASTLGKSMGKTESEIRDMVTKGQISFKVFAAAMDSAYGANATKANETYSGSLSNMRAALARMGAKFYTPHLEAQRDIFNSIAPAVDRVSTAIDPLIKLMAELSGFRSQNLVNLFDGINLEGAEVGFQNIADGLRNIGSLIGSVAGFVREAFLEIFPSSGLKPFIDLTQRFKDMTETMKLSGDSFQRIKSTFEGVFSIIKIGLLIVKSLVGALFNVLLTVGAGSGGVLAFTATLGEMIRKIYDFLLYTKAIDRFFKILVSPLILLRPLISLVSDLAGALSKLFAGDVSGFGAGINSAFGRFGETLSVIGNSLSNFVKGISSGFASASKSLFDFSSAAATRGNTLISGLLSGLAKMAAFMSSFVRDARGTLEKLISSMQNASDTGKSFLSGFGLLAVQGLLGIINGLTQVFNKLRSSMSFNFEFKNLTSGVSQASTSLSGLDTVGDKLLRFLETVGSFMGPIIGAFGDFFNGIGSAFSSVGSALSPVLASIGSFFKTLIDKFRDYIKTMDNQELVAAVNTGILVLLYLAFKKFVGNMKSTVGAFSDMAKSIGGTFDALKNSLGALTGAVRANIVMQIAIAVGVLVAALFILAKIDPAALQQALITLGVLFAQMAAMMLLLSKIPLDKLSGAGAAMIAVSIAVLILSSALEKLGLLDREVLIQGGLAVASLLAAMAGFAKLMTFAPGILAASAAMVIIAAALTLLAGVIVLYSKIPFEVMQQGLLAMAGTLLVLGVVLQAFPPNAAFTAIAIAIIANSLIILAGALAILGNLSLKVIGKGLLAIAGMMIILAIAANAMTGSIIGAAAMLIMATALTALAPALALLGALPFDIIKKGLFAIAAIMAIFVVAMYALTPVIAVLALFSTSLLVMGAAILLAGTGVYLFTKALGVLLLIGAAGFAVIVAGVTTLLALLPFMAQQAGYAFITFAQVIRDAAPKLIEAAGHILEEFSKEVERRVPAIAANGLDMIIGILEAIRSRIGDITNTAIDIVLIFINTLRERLPSIVQAGLDFIISFMEGLAEAIRGNRERTGAAGADLATALVDGLIAGLSSIGDRINKAVADLGNAVLREFKAFFGIKSPSTVFAELGVNIVEGLANGISGAFNLVKDAAVGLAEKLPGWMKDVLGIESPSKVFAEIGMYSAKGLAVGLDKHAGTVANAAANVGETATNALRASLRALTNINAENMDLTPTITPVFDLTDVKKGSAYIDRMLAVNPVEVSATVTKAADVSAGYNANQSVVATNSLQTQRDMQAIVASISAKASKPDVEPVPPRPVEFHIGTIQDGDSLVRRARATNRMLSLAEGGDSSQLERIL